MGTEGDVDRLRSYAPRLLLEWLQHEPDRRSRVVTGSVVFADISGFTKLSERLAARGRVGAEELTETISRCFDALLAVAYDDGASLLKFGGDATLLLFTGEDHAHRACRAAAAMRRTLKELGPIEGSGRPVTLRMSVGVHSGDYTCFLVGDSHRELVLTGPAFTSVVDMEATAAAGEIVVSCATAAQLPPRCVGPAKGAGRLLVRAPDGEPTGRAPVPPGIAPGIAERSLSTAVRTHLSAGVDEPEHRRVTVAFLHFDGTDALIERGCAEPLSSDLDALLRQVQASADAHGVTLLGTDVDRDGGKLILVAGAPVSSGDDETQMLLALREIADADLAVGVRIGVNAGPVFVGSVGPTYRRSYTVMGDAVNLAARVMSKAGPGQLLATESVIGRSQASFDTEALTPFAVKGKTGLVQAHAVGAVREVHQAADHTARPLVGRQKELAALQALLHKARDGSGSLVEVVGEAGLGKTRLIQELVAGAESFQVLTTTCVAYQALTPYFPFRSLLRQASGIPDGASKAACGAALLALLTSRMPELLPWAPLIAIPMDADVPSTTEVDRLDDRFVRARLQDVVAVFLGLLLDRPTLVAVDDTHWSDLASAELLQRISRDVATGPWLICVTRRDSDTGFVAVPAEHVVSLRPEPLDDTAARELAESLADADAAAGHLSPHDLAALAARSGGNPLFLSELVTSAAATGGVGQLPDSVEALIIARIDRLAAQDRMLLRRLSVFGQACDHALLVDALGDLVPSWDDPAWERLSEFILREGTVLRFEHGLVRDGAYHSLPFRLRRSLHAQIGAALEARAVAGDEDLASQLSLHYFHAGEYDQSWKHSLVAAEHASAMHANVEAVELYERAAASARAGAAVEPGALSAVYESAADLHSRLGKYDQADAAYRLAQAGCPREGTAVIRLLLKRGELRQRFGHYPAALRWLGRARRLAATEAEAEARRLQASILMAHANVAKDQARHRDAIAWCRRAMVAAEQAEDRATLALAYSVHDGSCSVLGRLDQAAFGDRALELYTELGDLRGQGMAHSNLGLLCIMRGRWDEGLAHWEKSQAALRVVGDEVNVAIISANVAEARLEQGRLAEAETYLLQAARVWAAAGDRASSAYAKRLQARVLSLQGRGLEALRRLERVREEFVAVHAEDEARETSARIAEALVLLGRAEQARSLTQELLCEHGLEQFHPLLLRVLGCAQAQLGDALAARQSLLRSLEAAEQAETDIEIAWTLRALARLGGPHAAEQARRSEELLERLAVVWAADPPLTPVVTVPEQAGASEPLSV